MSFPLGTKVKFGTTTYPFMCPSCMIEEIYEGDARCMNPNCRQPAPIVVSSFPCPSCGTQYDFDRIHRSYQRANGQSPLCTTQGCSAQLWPEIGGYDLNHLQDRYGIDVNAVPRSLVMLMVVFALRMRPDSQAIPYWMLIDTLKKGPDGSLTQPMFDQLLTTVVERGDEIIASWKQNSSSHLQRSESGQTYSNAILNEFHQFLYKKFSLSEMHDLCFQCGIQHENIGGETRTAFARGFIDYCTRSQMMPQLRTAMIEARPFLKTQLPQL